MNQLRASTVDYRDSDESRGEASNRKNMRKVANLYPSAAPGHVVS